MIPVHDIILIIFRLAVRQYHSSIIRVGRRLQPAVCNTLVCSLQVARGRSGLFPSRLLQYRTPNKKQGSELSLGFLFIHVFFQAFFLWILFLVLAGQKSSGFLFSVLKRCSLILIPLLTVRPSLVTHAHVRRPSSSACVLLLVGTGPEETCSPTELERFRLRPFPSREC